VSITVRQVPTFSDFEVETVSFLDSAYQDALVAVAYPAPTYRITSGSLPEGIVLDAVTGEISGTSTLVGTYNFKVTASNAAGSAESPDLQILIASQPTAIDLQVAEDVLLGDAYADGIEYDAYPAPTYSLATGSLPSGLSLNSATGTITGTASETGTYSFTILVSTPFAQASTSEFTINTILAPTFTKQSINPLVGVDQSYSDTVDALAYPAVTYDVASGQLPDGLELNANTGEISGTATKTGDFNFTISATNRVGSVETANMSIQVGIAPAEPFAAMPQDGFVGKQFNMPSTIVAFPIPVYTLESGELPPGLALDNSNGSISGVATEEGEFSFTVRATNWVGSAISKSYNLSIWAAPHLANSAELNGDINEGQPYSRTLQATGPNPVYEVTSGQLPEGLTLNPATGELSGTVSKYGEYKFVIRVTNLSGYTDTSEIRILVRSVPTFSDTHISPVVFNARNFSSQVSAFAFPAPTYQVVNGSLPAGIVLDPATGELSGASNDVGTYEFAIAAVAEGGTTVTDPLSIVVTSTPYAVDQLVVPQVLLGASYSDSVHFDSYPAPRYEVTSGSLPAGLSLDADTGAITGTATATGTYKFVVKGSTDFASTDTQEITIDVNQLPEVDDATIASSTKLGEAFSDAVSVKVYPAAAFSLASGELPPGVSLDLVTGALSGVSTQMGRYTFTIRATNTLGFVDFAETYIDVNAAPVASDLDLEAKGLVGASFKDALTYDAWELATYKVTKGALPDGLGLNAKTGTIAGTPSTPGVFPFTITASNTFGKASVSKSLTIEESTNIAERNFPDGVMGVKYKTQMTATGYPKPTFAIVEGSLPDGINLDTITGEVSGTAVETGTFDVTIAAINGTPNADRTSQVFIINEPAAKIVLRAEVGKTIDGAGVEVETRGAAPNADYEVNLYSKVRQLAKGKVPDDGVIEANLSIPKDIEPGWHHIELLSTLPNGKTLVKKTYFEITSTNLLETPPQEDAPSPTEEVAALTDDNSFYEQMGIDPSSLVSQEEAASKSQEVATVVTSLALVSTAAAAAASIASASSAVTASSMLGGATTIPSAPTAPAAPATGGAAAGGSTGGSSSGGGSPRAGGSPSGGTSGGSGGSGGGSGGSGGNSGGNSRADSNARTTSSDSSGSGGGDDDAGYGSLEGLLDDYTDDLVAWGDKLAIWKLKFMTFADMLGFNLAVKLSPFSPVAGKIVNDGAYLRAITGSLSIVPVLLAMFFGAMAVDGSALDIYNALNIGIFTFIIALGALDALAGVAGVAVVVALSLANFGWQDAGVGRYLLTLAMLGFAPIILSTTFRKIRRPRMSSVMDVWERVADLAILGFISALTTITLVKTVGSLAQVTLALTDYAVAIASMVALLAMIRVALEEVAAGLFTARMEKINPTSIVEGSVTQEWFSLFFKYAVLCYMISPLVGIGWHLWVGSAIIFLPGLISLLRLKLPTSKIIYQLLPGGIASLLAATVLSGWSGALIGQLFQALPNFKELAYVLTPLPVIAMALAGLFAEPGDKWYQKLKFSRSLYLVGGLGVFVLTILATGFLSQINV
jgi:hypothetical protein